MTEDLFREDMRFFNQGPTKNQKLTERVQIVVTPKMMTSIDNLINNGYFFNRSEFIRHLITRYLDNNKKWSK